MSDTEATVAISDPGEVGRAEHNRVDRLIVAVSNLLAWLFPILMLVICAQVFLRSFGRMGIGPGNQAWMDDLQWWLYGGAVLVGIAYAVTTNSHVRVDIFFDGFSERRKTRIEIFGLVWLFLPFVILCWDMSVHYAISSVVADEGSDSPNGLHNLWILKLAMNAAFVLIGVACWAAYVRFLSRLVRPTLFRQLLYALPSTVFLVNLAVYYALWWALKLTLRDPETGEPLTDRDVGRHAIFGTFDIGREEMLYTMAITLAATALLLLAAWLLQRRHEG